jgi:uncharacterized alkaline shock family protein YloU
MHIVSIIDDGLFIYHNRVLAGVSAKRQKNKIAAIKTALFIDEQHCKEVREKIAKTKPSGILILGTSDGMVEKIIERLELPKASMMIPIEEITTEYQREIARKQRKELGKHIIPAPTFQIKRQFSGYFLDPLRMFRGRGNKASYSEKTVVRPTYSYLGDYDLSDKVIADIVTHLGNSTKGVDSVVRVMTESNSEGVIIRVFVVMEFGVKIIDTAKELQRKIVKQVEAMTAFNIISVDIEIKGLK